MNLKLERRRGGFGKVKKGAIQYVTLRLAYELIHETPWECFAIIDRVIRCRGIVSADLELRDARDLGHVWQLTFEVVS